MYKVHKYQIKIYYLVFITIQWNSTNTFILEKTNGAPRKF